MAIRKRVPSVRLAKPKGRPWQLRYTCPIKKKEIRITTGTHDEGEAERQVEDLKAKLQLGIEPRNTKTPRGPDMSWDEFREEHTQLKTNLMADDTAYVTELQLDVCARIAKQKKLADMALPATLSRVQAGLLAGLESKKDKRSPHSVKSYMRALITSLNWAHSMNWLDKRILFKVLKTDTLDAMKGRPITVDEFKGLLEIVPSVRKRRPEGWVFLLRGLWESGLRIGEALNMTWDRMDTIHPVRTKGGHVCLRIPATCQKSRKDQTLPTIPGFAALLNEVPEDKRTGFIFNPMNERKDKRIGSLDHVKQIVRSFGEEAGIIVTDEGKFASAHDLRRSFGQRMADAGMLPRDLQKLMRHSSFTTTEKYYLKDDAAKQAERIADLLVSPPVSDDCTQFIVGTPSVTQAKRTHGN